MNKVPPRFLAERIGLFVAVACAVVYLVLKQFSILNNLDAEIGMLLFMVFVFVGDAILADVARELYITLLAPAHDVISRSALIILIPDGPLYDVPFQLLIDNR
jgi:hypothetical protein